MNIDKLINLIALVAWILFTVYTVVNFILIARRKGLVRAVTRLFTLRFVLPFVLTIAAAILSAGLVFIEPQESGVVISIFQRRGFREEPLDSGLHWKIPLLEQVIIYPVYWQTYTMSGRVYEGQLDGNDAILARTSDGQEVALDASVVYRIDEEQVVQVHLDWQDRYQEDLVRPIVRSIVRSQVSAFTVDEVNSQKRQNLESDLNNILEEELAVRGLILDQFLLRNIAFSPEYAASVEQKQVELQRITESQYEADQIRIVAQGEADALELIKTALAGDDDLLTYRYIEKLSPQIQVMLLPNDAPFLFPIPTPQPTLAVTQTVTTTVTPTPAATSTP